MNQIQRDLLDVISFELNKNNVNLENILNWEEIIKEAQKHKLANFVVDAMGTVISTYDYNNTLVALKNLSVNNLLQGIFVEQLQLEILNILNAHTIPYCIIKGSSIYSLYEKPRLRPSSDIDIYVSPDYFQEAIELLNNEGFITDKTTTTYHTSLIKNGVEVELHNTLAGLPKGNNGKNLYFLKYLTDRAMNTDINGIRCYYPNPCDNGIIQMYHIVHHILDEGANIRLLCDWMMLVKNYFSEDYWNNEIENIYNKVGLSKMAKVLTKTCVMYLGLTEEDYKWCSEIPDSICEGLINYIMNQADFDYKKQLMKLNQEKIYSKCQLKKDVWEFSGKHYLFNSIIRNLRMIVTGKRSLKQVVSIVKERKRKKRLLISLDLFNRKDVYSYAISA